MSIKLGELMKVWRIEEDYESIEIHGFNDDWYGTVKELKIGVLETCFSGKRNIKMLSKHI